MSTNGQPHEAHDLQEVVNVLAKGQIVIRMQFTNYTGKTGQIQPVEAFASTSSENSSEGFFQLCILRGRSLISEATIAK
jgi:hypothetical protein